MSAATDLAVDVLHVELALLAIGGPADVEALVPRTGLTPDRVAAALLHLRRADRAREDGGRWALVWGRRARKVDPAREPARRAS